MKHVFSVHSSITFLVAYSTIKYLDLNNSDVLILSSDYQVPINDFKVIKGFREAKNKSIFQKVINFNVPKKFDKYLNRYLNGEKFIAYVDLMSYWQRILTTHEKCVRFHFFEEGNSAYMAYDDDKDLTWEGYTIGMKYRSNLADTNYLKSVVRTLRGYNLRLLSLPYHYMAYVNFRGINFFCFSKNAFFNAPSDKKIILSPTKDDKNIIKLAGGHAYKNATIWLDGSNSRYTGLDESYYYKAIEKAIPILKAKGVIDGKVYVKLRPDIVDLSTNKLVLILKENGIIVEVMPNDLILEAFFMQSEDCKVIGVLTAALEYAHVFGHQVFSIYGLFDKQPPTFFDRMEGFWKNIINLKN